MAARTPMNEPYEPTGAGTSCCTSLRAMDHEALARVAKALSDPIRLEMLAMSAQGRTCCELPDPASRGVPGAHDPQGICVCEFQEQFGIGQSKVSYHLGVLKDAGLVTAETRGKWTFYSVDRAALDAALASFRTLLGP
jgi:ArsR family transcriptional regulator, arsenate/arsenite/antimonite-responsive transcriptional repressor